jgi:serine/threonine protein kinase
MLILREGTATQAEFSRGLEPRAVVRTDSGQSYEIVASLGTGAYGVVYSAVDMGSGERVALKQLRRTEPSAIARFKQEFRALQGIHHPNVVRLRHLIQHADDWLIVMDLIEGDDFLSWVRPEALLCEPDNDGTRLGALSESRLRSTLIDVSRGLSALHEHGVLHRDLKPSNIRVTADGRAVLVDFGLVAELTPEGESSHQGSVGTVAYMPLEQAKNERLTPAADWYALGGCLFEALTGRLPFPAESPFEILLAKKDGPVPDVLAFAPQAPSDLAELCAKLLVADAESRASGHDVLRVVSFGTAANPVPLLGIGPALPVRGRERELAILEAALKETDAGGLRIVLVEGESGIGKSTLIADFVRRARLAQPKLLALHSRCYEGEWVAYSAFDGAMDQLAKHFLRAKEADLAARLPRRSALLGDLFPVLRGVRAITSASRRGISAEPTAQRLEAFAAMVSLLARLADERPVVLTIDDLQWADSESFRLLEALVQASDPPNLLIVASVRPRFELAGSVSDELAKVHAWPMTRSVSLPGIPRHSCMQVAVDLAGADCPMALQLAVAEESQGHPLLITELVRFAHEHPGSRRLRLSLDAALRERIAGLPDPERRLLELVALAERPTHRAVLGGALGDPERVHLYVSALLGAQLIETRQGELLCCRHDRIRAAAIRGLSPSMRAQHHRGLAEALRTTARIETQELARHHEGAGNGQAARTAYAQAAREAMDALAFQQAVQHGSRALALWGETRDDAWANLMIEHGHALSKTGQCEAAAVAYEQAIPHLADVDQRLRVSVLHAQALVQGAKVEAGVAAARAVLTELGEPLPTSTLGTLAEIGWGRARVKLFGLASTPAQSTVEPATLRKLDALHALSLPMMWTDPLRGLALTSRHMRHALAAGDPNHMALALAQEAMFRALQRPEGAAAQDLLLARADELTGPDAAPKVRAFILGVRGVALNFRFDTVAAQQLLEQALHLFESECPGEPWLLTNLRAQLAACWLGLGEHARFANEVGRWLQEARARGDRFAIAALAAAGFGAYRHLISDDPEAALAELEEAMRPWPRTPCSFVHVGHVAGRVLAHTYQNSRGGWEFMQQHAPALSKEFVFKTPFAADWLSFAWVNSVRASMLDAHGDERPEMQSVWARGAAALSASPNAYFRALGFAYRAELELLGGRRDRAECLTTLRSAHESLTMQGRVDRHSVGYLLGKLEGGDAGQELCRAAHDFYRTQGYRDPDRFLEAKLPTLALLGVAQRRSQPTDPLIHGRYRRGTLRKKGGRGRVYDATEARSGRRLSLRALTGASAADVARFKAEFRALQRVYHPGLSRLDALFVHEDTWYIAAERVVGESLLEWVRPEDKLDLTRFRDAFTKILEALSALHEAGFLHRDLRADNVLVNFEGRVVLDELGFIVSAADAEQGPSGSAAFMAPEQVEGCDVAEAADLYAVGVCMYLALTGRLPIEQPTDQKTMEAKQRGRPIPPCVLGIKVPAELEQLCLSLLEREPPRRPSVETALRTLAGEAFTRPRSSIVPSRLRAAQPIEPLAGRRTELAWFDGALAKRRTDGPTLLFVQGESGLGKSALVSEWLRRAAEADPRSLVLRSQCYENAQAPYEAFDAGIVRLAALLRLLPAPELLSLLPERPALLPLLFPSLGEVAAIAEAPKRGLPADPTVRRMQAMAALRELLDKLARTRPVLLAIDDLQWADPESFELLLWLAATPGPPLTIVATVRPDDELASHVRGPLAQLRTFAGSQDLTLSNLSPEEALTLVAARAPDISGEALEHVIAEAQGHPLFLRTLAAHLTRAQGGGRAPSLEDALAAQVAALQPEARELLELVVLAGRPCPLHVFARIAAPRFDFATALSILRRDELVRVRRDQELTTFHDRIRAATLRQLDAARSHELAGLLVQTLGDDPAADPADCGRLWLLAGDAAAASEAFERAGRTALEVLAFGRAERAFAQALELMGETRNERWLELMRQRGLSLAQAGRGQEASAIFGAAVEHATGTVRSELRVLEAQQCIQGGELSAGLSRARSVLTELGIDVPTSVGGSLARIGLDRLTVATRGLGVAPRDQKQVGRQQLEQLEALRALSFPIMFVDVLAGAVLTSGHLRRARAAREPSHLARALAQEAAFRAMQRPERRAEHEELLVRAEELASRVGDPALDAYILFMRGSAAQFRFEPEPAAVYLEPALAILQEKCPGETWLLANLRSALSTVRWGLAAYTQHAEELDTWMLEARARGDRFALAALAGSGLGLFRHLLRDRPDLARQECQEILAPWPEEPWTFIHIGYFAGLVRIAEHEGSREAYDWWRERESLIAKQFVMKTRFVRELVGACVLGATFSALPQLRGQELDAAMSVLARDPYGLRRSKVPWLMSVRSFTDGLLAWKQGDRARALACLNFALTHKQTFMMDLHVQRLVRGMMEGGASGQTRIDSALAGLRNLGFERPEKSLMTYELILAL